MTAGLRVLAITDDTRFVRQVRLVLPGAGCAGWDYVLIGRAAILHHDFPQKVAADPDFVSIALPVTRQHLRNERLGPAFVEYMNNWKGFVAQPETAKTP